MCITRTWRDIFPPVIKTFPCEYVIMLYSCYTIFPVTEKDTFCFYPKYFVPLKNTLFFYLSLPQPLK